MKKLLIIILLFISVVCNATNYHVKTGGDDAANGDITHPWATITKVNTVWASGTFAAGDSINFNRGNTFYGSLLITESGTTGNPIIVGAYGTGINPIITGLTALTSWTQVGATNVYYATLDVPRLNIVTLDGVVKGMGRFPNTGYLNYESHNAKVSITDSVLTGTPDWTGAEIGIRKNRWIIDRHVVTNHTNGTLTYNSLNNWGNNTIYTPVNKNGYFFQNDIKCLDDLGDWCYDAAAKRIYMYFSGSPSGYTVKTGSLDYNLNTNQQSYIDVNNIDFEGANISGIYIKWNGSYVIITNCNFYSQGGNAIFSEGTLLDHIIITGGSITNVLNNALHIIGDYTIIDGVTITNAGYIVGAGKSGDVAYVGITTNGSNTIIKNCTIINAGWCGINFGGNVALIKNNLVNTFCSIKDDGGGIYTINSDAAIIQNNIVLNGIGAFAGVESETWEGVYGTGGKAAYGIYLDGLIDHNAIVTGNTVFHTATAGIFNNPNGGNTITNNTVYDCYYQLYFNEPTVGQIRGDVITGNKFIAKTTDQKALFFQMYNTENPSLFGMFDNNYYARPIDDNQTIRRVIYVMGSTSNYTLAGWQAYSGQDAGSHKSSITVADTSLIEFYYNTTNINRTVNLPTPMIDVTGVKYTSLIIIPPFSSAILMPDPSPGGAGINYYNFTNAAGKTLVNSSGKQLVIQ